jgi:hypothetical protein
MGSTTRLIALLATLLAGPAMAQGTFGQAQPGDAQPDAKGERKALLIGINDYAGDFAPLRYADADATALGDALRDPQYGGFSSVEVITDGDLSSSALVEKLRAWGQTLSSEDFAFVYFSGHGVRWIDERNRSRVFLATPSTSKANPLGNAIPLTALQEFLETLPAKRRAMLIDACLTGDGKVSSADADAASKAAVDESFPFTERASSKEALLFATTWGRPALESEQLGHGVFTAFFLDALTTRRAEADINGDAVVSIAEAHDWARDGTMQATGDVQVPMVIYKIIGREELIVSGKPGDRKAAEVALVTSYQGPQAGIVMFVDGQEKGGFPRSVPVPTGPRVVEFRNDNGVVVDRGRFDFKPGVVYDAATIRNAFNGGRFALQAAYAHYLFPGASHVSDGAPHGPGFRFGLGVRFGGKSPAARAFGIDGDLGFAVLPPFEPDEGSVTAATMPETVLLAAGLGPSFRLKIAPAFVLSAMPRAGLLFLLRTGVGPGEEAVDPAERIFKNWVLGTVGARFAATIRPSNAVAIQIGYTPAGTLATLEGSAAAGGPGVHLLHRWTLGAQFAVD